MTNLKNNLAAQLGDLVLGIDHVAIAVADIDTSITHYSAALGFALVERSEVSGEFSGMLYAVMHCGSATIVLVQGTSPASQVSKFLESYGSGMHHIAFAVSDLDAAIHKAKLAGAVADTPVVSDEGIRQTFLQRDGATGVRIELIERHGAAFSEHNVLQLFKALEAKDLF